MHRLQYVCIGPMQILTGLSGYEGTKQHGFNNKIRCGGHNHGKDALQTQTLVSLTLFWGNATRL